MLPELERAMRGWDAEVDAEAARLVEAGVAPFDAVVRARDSVSARRRKRAAESAGRRNA
jgi:hypothetical protein